jgi:predicted acyltransferase
MRRDDALKTRRLDELDLLRGLSVIGMLLVVTPGHWEQNFSWLVHAPWEGLVPADMIFPGFLFCVGYALPLSLSRRIGKGAPGRQLAFHFLTRAMMLVGIGVLLNLLYSLGWEHVRLPGILQSIALGWLMVGGLLLLANRGRSASEWNPRLGLLVAFGIFLLTAYWMLLTFVPVPGYGAGRFDSVGSWAAFIDRAVFGVNHLWIWGQTDGVVTYDPEGLLSTLSASINVLTGAVFANLYLRNPEKFRPARQIGAGAAFMTIGLLASLFYPPIKQIWTGSFALFSSGVALALLGGFSLLVTNGLAGKLLFPVKVYGSNALLVFIISGITFATFDKSFFPVGAEIISFRMLGLNLFNSFLPDIRLASLAFAFTFVCMLYPLLWFLHSRRWFLKL